MNWSHYQTAIFEAVRRGDRSLRVKALAGSGKSTVLEECIAIELAERPSSKVVLVSFNKDIEVAMNARLERRGLGKLAKTCHAVGLAAWRGSLGEAGWELKVDKDKVRGIVDKLMTWPEKRKYPQVGRLVGLAKQVGLVPRIGNGWAADCMAGLHGLVEDEDNSWEDLIDHYGIDPDEVSVDCARRVLAESVATAREVVDFDDMLYMPIVAGVAFEKYDAVFVDEAQDLSGIQHEMIARMVRTGSGRVVGSGEDRHYIGTEDGRVIACGDEHQAIYGWRGAHANSMDVLGERFNCLDLPLSITYRCPVAVVEHARQWVPELEPREDASWGVVLGEKTDWEGQAEVALGASCGTCAGTGNLNSSDMNFAGDYNEEPCWACNGTGTDKGEAITKWRNCLRDFLPGDAILCRVNRPLVAVAFALIRAKVPARVLGRDIGQGLAALVRKLGKDLRLVHNFPTDFGEQLAYYRDKQGGKLRRRGKLAEAAALEDRLDTLQVFVDELGEEDGLQELLGSITRLFGEAGEVKEAVILSTVHKAKGMEWPRVFILDASELMPSPWARRDWEIKQEANISYVACTRAKRELRYIKSESLLHGGE